MAVAKSKSNSQEISFLAGDACLYSVVKRSASALGWKLIGESASDKAKRNCHVIWVDRSFVSDKLFLSIQPWQRINHFPGMTNICRKTRLAQNLELMRKKFPYEFGFYPQTFILPQNSAAFKALFVNGYSKQPFIIKPDGSAQGKGIFLTKSLEDVQNLQMACVAQQYIRNPLLIDNKKFDLRIYLLVMSCYPLRLYLFRDGLCRICTEEYHRPNTSNMDDRCMHLTNYAVNKRSEKYEREETIEDQGLGSKRSISWLLAWLSKERGEDKAKEMWAKIGDICVMTVLSILPTLQREYSNVWTEPDPSQDEGLHRSQCFEILGFDVMVDNTLRPYLIEVNHLPSWGTDSPLDDHIKSRVITQALRAIDVKASDRKNFESQGKKQSRLRLGKLSAASTTAESAVEDDSNQQTDSEGTSIENDVSLPKQKQPILFDSNSAERKIRAIYAKYAPEKLEKLPNLMKRFRGYEEWLVMKVQDKYEPKDHPDDESSSDERDCSSHEKQNQLHAQHLKFHEEEAILEDYDRIYPPKVHGRISPSCFSDMENYVAEVDAQQQQRLLRPLQQIRCNEDAPNNSTINDGLSRADGWVGGNRQAKQQPKVVGPPTKQQIEFADRLSKGFSTGDVETSRTLLERRKSRMLHHDFVHEEINPFYQLIDRIRQSRELSKEARQRAERKLSKRLETGVALKQQQIDIGLSNEESCLRLRPDARSKFYGKKYHALGQAT